ncbi:hypothetical protein B0H21DRAFT_693303 [Amylocystis lapponica]|nr:hypothetical protein B0H21DRAFT_693303 [Amylocystis lapponica]
MVQPIASIRPYELKDLKMMRFIIGKAQMEPLAVANRKFYAHPWVLAVWVALSCIFVQLMNWWPKPEVLGFLSYLSPLPAFASVAVPLMFISDWLNRSEFEDRTQDVLRRTDLVDPKAYYSRSPSSGCWILEYDGNFVGLIAVDASLDSMSDATVATNAPSPSKTKSGKSHDKKGTSSIAKIRHFYVEEAYRRVAFQKDLLRHAVTHAFVSDQTVQSLLADESPLAHYIGQALQEQGFRLQRRTERVGVLKWQNSSRILERKWWKQ